MTDLNCEWTVGVLYASYERHGMIQILESHNDLRKELVLTKWDRDNRLRLLGDELAYTKRMLAQAKEDRERSRAELIDARWRLCNVDEE